jgi:hypothetical protein
MITSRNQESTSKNKPTSIAIRAAFSHSGNHGFVQSWCRRRQVEIGIYDNK